MHFGGHLRTALEIGNEKRQVLVLVARRGLGAAPRLPGQNRAEKAREEARAEGGGARASLSGIQRSFSLRYLFELANEMIKRGPPMNSEPYLRSRDPRGSKAPSDRPWEALGTLTLPVTRLSPCFGPTPALRQPRGRACETSLWSTELCNLAKLIHRDGYTANAVSTYELGFAGFALTPPKERPRLFFSSEMCSAN